MKDLNGRSVLGTVLLAFMHAIDPMAVKVTIPGAREQSARSWKLNLGSILRQV